MRTKLYNKNNNIWPNYIFFPVLELFKRSFVQAGRSVPWVTPIFNKIGLLAVSKFCLICFQIKERKSEIITVKPLSKYPGEIENQGEGISGNHFQI